MDNINVLIIEDTPAEKVTLVKVLKANNYTVVGIATTYTAITLFLQ
jgi:DNA-binding response OmpR family regulator